VDALHHKDHKSPRVHVDTPTKKRETCISCPVAKGTSVKRATYVSKKDAIHVGTLTILVAKETSAVKEAPAGLRGYVSPVAAMTSHAVRTIPAARVTCVALIHNAMRAEGTIRPAVKGMCAKNGLSVAQIVIVTPVEVMTAPVVKEMCAKRVMRVDQMENASHVEAMNNHAA